MIVNVLICFEQQRSSVPIFGELMALLLVYWEKHQNWMEEEESRFSFLICLSIHLLVDVHKLSSSHLIDWRSSSSLSAPYLLIQTSSLWQ